MIITITIIYCHHDRLLHRHVFHCNHDHKHHLQRYLVNSQFYHHHLLFHLFNHCHHCHYHLPFHPFIPFNNNFQHNRHFHQQIAYLVLKHKHQQEKRKKKQKIRCQMKLMAKSRKYLIFQNLHQEMVQQMYQDQSRRYFKRRICKFKRT